MTDILVGPGRLRWGAAEIERVAGEADAAVRDLNIPTLVEGINPEYAVQLATKVRGYGAQLVGQTAPVIHGLRGRPIGLPVGLFQDRQVADREGNVLPSRDQTAPYIPEHDLFRKPVPPAVREVYD